MNAAPELRFPNFGDEWSAEKLGKRTLKVGSGATPRGGSTAYVDEGIPFIRSQNIRNNRLDLSDVAFIPAKTHRKMSNSAVGANDVLLNITGASIGRSAVVSADFDEGNVNQHVCIIRLDDGSSPAFLQAYISSHRGQKGILQAQSGSGREGLNFENIRNFKIAFPTIAEQQKIAAFLGAVDDKIDALRRKHDALKQFKAGLMQKLFSQELRFKRDDGSDYPDWEEMRLGDIADTATGDGNREDSQESGTYRFFDRSTDKRWTESYTHDCEALIIAGEGKDFSPTYFSGKFSHHQRVYAVIVEAGDAIPKWLYYCIDFHRQYFLKVAVGSTMPSLRKPMFENMPLSVPHPDEQAEIASFLTAIDARIEAEANQITNTESFKAGLLQKMFV